MSRKGGSETKGGFYWKKGDWEIVTVEGKSGTLPGTDAVEYLRIPGILFVPVALTISIVYVIFFPFIGFAMLAKVITTKVRRELRRSRGPAGEKLAPETPGEKPPR
ncbi:MAG: hypothetical protein P8Z30_20055 [Acidobacteriota bacterium]